MKCLPDLKSISNFMLGCFLVALTGQVVAEQFEPPKLDGFNLHAESDADGDGDGKNETHVKQYFNASGAVSYTHLTLPTICFKCRSRWSPYH